MTNAIFGIMTNAIFGIMGIKTETSATCTKIKSDLVKVYVIFKTLYIDIADMA